MLEPRPYPPTDSAEQDAVATLLSLIDAGFVKADIRIRDKYPNIDGTLELVDQRQVPLGKLEVQVRKIGHGERKYSCPVSLVRYSEVSTLPVILICVNTSTKLAFWRQITPMMPEVKKNQKSFTLYFSEASDAIDDKGIYIQKWTDIVRDYQERISKFPVLSAEVANKLKLEGIKPQDREVFQRFIDTVNSMLDNDFIAIKELLFPDVWKLGVGLISSDQQRLRYQIYQIPYAEPYPLVCKLEGGILFPEQRHPHAISESVSSRDHLANPIEAGSKFVLDHVRNVVEQMTLPIYGQMLAADVLIAFVDRYYRCLGIEPWLGRYSFEALDYALNQHLFSVCAAIAMKMTPDRGVHLLLDLDEASRYLERNDVKPVALSDTYVHFYIRSKRFSVRSAFESLRYLSANEITTIDRPFAARRTMPLSPGANWIWSGYSRDDEVRSVMHILKSSIDEYSTFVRGNRLQFPNSPYLDSDTSIVFEYERVGSTTFDGPGLREHHIHDPQRTLPKLSVFVKTDEERRIDTNGFPIILINGDQYNCSSSSLGHAGFLFQPTPVLNLIYRMLTHDLSAHYNMSMIVPVL